MIQFHSTDIHRIETSQQKRHFHFSGIGKLLLFLGSCLFSLNATAEEPTVFSEPISHAIEGWAVKIDPELQKPENAELLASVQTALANHLQRIKYILANEKIVELQKLGIWIDFNDQALDTMQYHPSEAWLKSNGHNPALAKHVHIPRAKALLDRRQWAKHPYVVLHELAHAYHDQVLDFENAEIKDAFELAKKEAIYDQVLSHSSRQVKHYALSNHKEYFAESTEAYLGVNDFYPFVRAELKQHDPRMYRLLEKIWGKID